MAEYIEREQARQVICGWCEYDTCLADDYYWNKCDAKGRLDAIPSADVKPVVHGHWVYAVDSDIQLGSYRCSACGNCSPHVTNYCGLCGADMRR